MQHAFEDAVDIIDIEELIAEQRAREAKASNGGPSLEPSFSAMAAIAGPVLGERWIGKLAPEIAEHPRQIRRWQEGVAVPSPRAFGATVNWALTSARHLLASVGEDDLAFEVGRVIDRRKAVAMERGRAMMEASRASA